MEKKINFLNEEELKEADSTILNDYLVTLESIECGLNEIINENKKEEEKENEK